MNLSNAIKLLTQTSLISTVRFNFHYFKLAEAIRFPILVSRHINIIDLSGKIIVNCPIRRGVLKLGYHGLGTRDTRLERTKWEVSGTITIDGQTSLGRGTNISVTGDLKLGRDVTITGSSTIICYKSIVVGDNALISWDCLIMDTDFHKIKNSDGIVTNPDEPIIIGKNVWIGCRNLILKGAAIPSGSVVAASSIITKRLQKENCLYGGQQGGAILKEDILWEK